ncbi:hypothetical protein [Leucobacter ruminantium]|uniref:Uncharacterized protein n=1 Tax=Leucobacter ruminantium TaxID=1289170 RepID=A0A939LUR8_9MICO|nr:hypothetical protein [Leucobacter ruminantium]MBO1805159.1 hypothetical protein [Leucobacter ruminantium]
MGENNERNIYRAIVLVLGLVAAIGLIWYLGQGGEGLQEDGIFELFSNLPDPNNQGHQGE